MTRKEQEELGMIENAIKVEFQPDETGKLPVQGRVTYHYPLLKDPWLLSNNRAQAIAMAAGNEKRLIKRGEVEAYNKELKDYIDRGVIRKLSEEEMAAWTGPVNYISHHGVEKPASTTTALRVVSNSSLDNNHQGISYNDILPKGPNSLVPLIQAIITWRSYEDVVVWDLSKAYNVVHTFLEELNMRRLVWRWGRGEGEWETRMHFGDRPAMAGLKVTKHKVADLGMEIDPSAARMIK